MAESSESLKPTFVWDIPTRLFHWTLVVLLITLWLTAEDTFFYNMELHMYCGYAVLGLVIFRLLWGIVGSVYARFSNFLYGMSQVTTYIKGLVRFNPPIYIGHNPVGGWSIVLMLTVLLVQAGTGLFANDDIFTEGPFASWVSHDTSRLLTSLHALNFDILLMLAGVHILAVFFYLFVKKENLVRPMFTGYKHLPTALTEQAQPVKTRWWLALLLIGGVAGGVYSLVFIVA